MFRWYKELGADEKRSFWACFGGWATDALDVQIYSFVVPALISLWNLSKADAGLLATSALLLSAFGGWTAGILADRIGRVRMLQITIAWFSVFTFLSGLSSNFGQLLVIRGLQGLGFGGEWAGRFRFDGGGHSKRTLRKTGGYIQLKIDDRLILYLGFPLSDWHLRDDRLFHGQGGRITSAENKRGAISGK